MPCSLVAWITNQMHLAQTLIVLTALVLVARRSGEVARLVAAATALRRRVLHGQGGWRHAAAGNPDGPRDPRVVSPNPAFGRRHGPSQPCRAGSSSRSSPGDRRRSANSAATAGRRCTPRGSTTRAASPVSLDSCPADRPWQPLASWFAALLPIVAIAAWRWISAGARACLLAGIAIAALFNVPFVFVTKAEQMYSSASARIDARRRVGGVTGSGRAPRRRGWQRRWRSPSFSALASRRSWR